MGLLLHLLYLALALYLLCIYRLERCDLRREFLDKRSGSLASKRRTYSHTEVHKSCDSVGNYSLYVMTKKWLYGRNVVLTGCSTGMGKEVLMILVKKYGCNPQWQYPSNSGSAICSLNSLHTHLFSSII